MRIPQLKLPFIYDLINTLYTSPLDESLIQTISKKTCAIIDAHYFGLVLLPDDKRSAPLLVTNNPPEFMPAYNFVYREDFLTEALVTTGKGCVLQRIPDWEDKRHQNFLHTLESVRPASDGIYLPIKTEKGILCGYWALARAGSSSPAFSNNDVEIFRFLTAFMSDAYKRSLRPAPRTEDLAYLDYEGHLISAGDRIGAVFRELSAFCPKSAENRQRPLPALFLSRFSDFVRDPFRAGRDKVNIRVRHRLYSFAFRILDNGAAPFKQFSAPYASVSLLEAPEEFGPKMLAIGTVVGTQQFNFTTREYEVLSGIYRGMSNKEIAGDMRIDESTVKRHTHNIYSKTGFRSRVELVLGLPRHENSTLVESCVSKREAIL